MLSLMTILAVACKKDKLTTAITFNELKDYYIAVESFEAYSVIYFNETNGTKQLIIEGIGGAISLPFDEGKAILSNDSIYVKAGSNKSYLLSLKRDNNRISINSSKTTNPDFKNLEIYKTAEAPLFYNKNGISGNREYTYITSNLSYKVFLRFIYYNNNSYFNWRYEPSGPIIAPQLIDPIFVIGKDLGFREIDKSSFGISVPTWNGNYKTTFLFQTTIDNPKIEKGIHVAVEVQ